MKNGYTPKEFAHATAIAALRLAHMNKRGELDELTEREKQRVRVQIDRLITRLATAAHLEVTPIAKETP